MSDVEETLRDSFYEEVIADNDEEDLLDVCIENSNFLDIFEKSESVERMLKRDNFVYLRGTTVDSEEQDRYFHYDCDVDGCVIELSSWGGVKLPLRHLTIMKNGLKPVKSFLRKHLDLKRYCVTQINDCVGFQLFYEGGWEGWIGLIPKITCPKVQVKKEIYDRLCLTYFENLKILFQRKLFSQRDKLRKTLVKNDMNDVKKLTILPDDVHLVLTLLQEALNETEMPTSFTAINFCFRFGEKATNPVSLSSFDKASIRNVTAHCAINISSEKMGLVWSLSGLKSVVGNRGSLNTCLSFRDSACYQSNLDGKSMDITPDLRNVCIRPENLRFVQLYIDHPHRRPNTRYNPVSGCIAGGMVFHKNTSDTFFRDAKSYISTMESNFVLMDKCICRAEYVCELSKSDLTENLKASDCISVVHLKELLTKRPMLAPLPVGTPKLIRAIGIWIVKNLQKLFETYSKTGNIEAVWKTFQYELSIEKLLWGYPLCFQTHSYSVNLGPGKFEQSRSLTDYLGFLALERWSACMSSDETIPSCRIWTQSDMMSDKIKRSVGVHDVLSSGPSVLGRKLLHALIKDLYVTSKVMLRFEDFLSDLHADHPKSIKVQGAATVQQLVFQLAKVTRVGIGMVFRSLCELTKGSGHDLVTILEAGLNEIGIKHFPSIQNYDSHGNRALSWNWRAGLVKLVSCERELESSPSVLSSAVISQLKIRNLMYESRLTHLRRSTLPWIATCANKLKHLNLQETQLLNVLCFVSCIALIMNGLYVDYNEIQKLLLDIPFSQRKLQDLEIQSKLLLSERVSKFKLFRIHSSIPFRLSDTKSDKKKDDRNFEELAPPEDKAPVIENENVSNRIPMESELLRTEETPRNTYSLPFCRGVKRRWDGEELEILHDVKNLKFSTVKDMYESYKLKCAQRNIPFRTFRAVSQKINQL